MGKFWITQLADVPQAKLLAKQEHQNKTNLERI